MQDVLNLQTKYEKVILVRSLIPTREIGFLPGDEEDKAALYQVPYQNKQLNDCDCFWMLME